jgi:hypothetical protein
MQTMEYGFHELFQFSYEKSNLYFEVKVSMKMHVTTKSTNLHFIVVFLHGSQNRKINQ